MTEGTVQTATPGKMSFAPLPSTFPNSIQFRRMMNGGERGSRNGRSVVRARPRFPGHYQPHLPADLGFYDLRLPEARTAQAELAASYGIHGFCFYHYWFNGRQASRASGKRDLEKRTAQLSFLSLLGK